jgi:hypothetical protein
MEQLPTSLSSADAIFEHELQATPFSLKAWLAYIDSQRVSSRPRLALYERALAHLPGSYKLWRAYLAEAVKVVRQLWRPVRRADVSRDPLFLRGSHGAPPLHPPSHLSLPPTHPPPAPSPSDRRSVSASMTRASKL